tara:strand:- start:134 stop:1327 length:1194 start_codon:yes stop_codon:yes gene_type:complete
MEPLDEAATERIVRALAGARNPVQVGFTIYSVDRLNPVENSFEVDIKFYTRWHDGAFAADPDMVALRSSGTLANGTPIAKLACGKFPDVVIKELELATGAGSRPHLDFANATSCELVEGSEVVYLSPNDELGWVRAEARYRCVFKYTMDVHYFPFDVQCPRIIVRMSERCDRGRPFEPYVSQGVGELKEIKDWVKLPEWTRYEPVSKFELDSRGRARWLIEIGLRRRALYYLQNVVGVNAIITSICFTAFGIPLVDLGDRLSVCLTMLLTAVAFKIVLGDALPKVSYQTVMDVYLNGSFGCMLVCTLSTFVFACWARLNPASADEPWLHDKIDLVAFCTLSTAYVLFHVYFVRRCKHAIAEGSVVLAGRQRASDANHKLQERLRRQVSNKVSPAQKR